MVGDWLASPEGNYLPLNVSLRVLDGGERMNNGGIMNASTVSHFVKNFISRNNCVSSKTISVQQNCPLSMTSQSFFSFVRYQVVLRCQKYVGLSFLMTCMTSVVDCTR